MKKFRNFIDGQHVDAAKGDTLDIINPATGKVYATSPNSKQADIDAAMAAAQRGFDVWKESTPSERSLALFRIADAIEKRKDEFIAMEVENCGKPVAITTSEEIPPMVDQIRFFAGAARMLEGKSAGEYMKGFTSMIRREPVGVCAQVAPWNYPMMMAVWKFAPAIAAGNSIVLKPSDTTPATTVLLAEIAAEFLPAGVFNVVCGDRDTGRTMVAHPTPAMVSVTGSVRAGMEVAEAASKSLKRVHLELGGKAPVVVFDDADLAAAAAQISMTGYFNAGQDCTAATRVIAGPKVYGDFVEALAEAAKGTKTGAPNDDVLYGALNNANQLARVNGFIEKAPKHARVVAGGNKIGNDGYFFEPTVVAALKQDDEMIQNEIFGPGMTVQRFSDEDEALRWANGVEYGLA
ncbi:MAG: aldehyde dehydrogenase family protein, partial [Ilumatobacteraceae bacterium]